MKLSKQNAEHYIWGGQCDGWRLINEEGRSIIHERMPAGTREARHYHRQAKQFFFVLSGILAIEIDGIEYELHEHEGIEVSPSLPHKVINKSEQDVQFLVISTPNTSDDRVNLGS